MSATRTITMTPEPVSPGETVTICVTGEPTGPAEVQLSNGSVLDPDSDVVVVDIGGAGRLSAPAPAARAPA